MTVKPNFRAFVEGQLSQIVDVRSRAMFGGVGIYGDGLFFAIIAGEQVYFKVDDSTRPDYERCGWQPFRPFDDDRVMQYYEIPLELLENPPRLRPWVEKAIETARAAKKGK